MNLEKLTLGEVSKLAALFQATDTRADEQDGGIRIVILQRGWVMVGRYSRKGSECKLTGASNVRKWGTSKGLGEIAEGGPTKDTVLDPVPEVTFHELTVIATLACEESKWAKHCK